MVPLVLTDDVGKVAIGKQVETAAEFSGDDSGRFVDVLIISIPYSVSWNDLLSILFSDKRLNVVLIQFLILRILSLLLNIKVVLPPNVTVPALLVFGDSIVDSGNNNHLPLTFGKCNFHPYGLDFDGGVATGRFTNSKTPADLLVKELGIKDLLPAYLDPNLQSKDLPTGVTFASGGTGYDTQTSTLAEVIPLEKQLKMFQEYLEKLKSIVGEKKTSYILANSVFLLVAVSNDLANTYFSFGFRRFQYDVPSYADFLVSKCSEIIKELYDLGARRLAVFGAPPIGCLPIQRTLAGGLQRTCVDKYNDAAKLYNTKLSSKLDSLAKNLSRSNVVYIDIYNPLFDIIQNPQAYGFDTVDKGCCGTGDIETLFLCNKFSKTCPEHAKFLFWDSIHPTEAGYKILVNRVVQENIHKLLIDPIYGK
ncbi:GDSL esterase/lipase EXL3-like [Apium graveolens]|uniref:GDSL esterase/lipase EXL3-like n=1 Tax=Apium graveolens TaxID=4045 RepID=UPI003D7B6164